MKKVKEFVFGLIVVGVSLSFVNTVNIHTQTPGNRIETNLAFILLDRVVYPNMLDYYHTFPDEIRAVITEEEAQEFDEHNNNVMYLFAPAMEAKVGKNTAERYYIEMAEKIFREDPLNIVFDIAEDSAAFIFMPMAVFVNQFGLNELNTDWNTYCMSTRTPILTSIYNNYYIFSFALLFTLTVIVAVYTFVRKKERRFLIVMKYCSLWGAMTLVTSFGFSLCDGAAPNDRYVLIGYLFWMMFVCGMLFFNSKDKLYFDR